MAWTMPPKPCAAAVMSGVSPRSSCLLGSAPAASSACAAAKLPLAAAAWSGTRPLCSGVFGDAPLATCSLMLAASFLSAALYIGEYDEQALRQPMKALTRASDAVRTIRFMYGPCFQFHPFNNVRPRPIA